MMLKFYQTTLLVCSLITCFQSLKAQVPDSTFGSYGKVYTLFGNATSHLESSLLLSDGKILSAGWNGNTTLAVLVTRHLPDGSPDSSLNGTGSLQFSFGFTYEDAFTLLELDGGRFAVAGSSFGNAAIAVFKSNGEFDSTFNNNGRKTFSFGQGNGSRVESLILQDDGKLVLAGRAFNGNDFDFMLCRIKPDGSSDSSFNGLGQALYKLSDQNDFGMSAGFQSNGRIILGGFSKDVGGVNRFAVIRVKTNGEIDSSFAQDGIFIWQLSDVNDEIESIDIDTEDRIVVAGLSNQDMITFRLTVNGQLDQDFNQTGYVLTDFNGNADRAYAVKIMENGNILSAGWITTNFGNNDFACVNLLPDGTANQLFGVDGKFSYEMGSGGSWVKEILVQDDEKIILCGQASIVQGGYGHFALLRLNKPEFVGNTSMQLTRPSFQIYPNPAQYYLDFRLADTSDSFFTARIMDISGKEILEFNPALNQRIDLTSFASGTYIIQVQSAQYSSISRFLVLPR